MGAKIEKKSDKIGTFGGIFQTIDCFRSLGLDKLVDNTLKARHNNANYKPSDIVENMLSVYCTGGTCIEDTKMFRSGIYGRNGEYRFASPDTIHRLLRENAVENTIVESSSGQTYNFNVNARLSELLIKGLVESSRLKKGVKCDFDYDNVLLPCEKSDASWSYKKCRGYFPGVALADGYIVGVENRDGNANVKTDQEKTLERIYSGLKSCGIEVSNSRMDCGSYSKAIVEVVSGHSDKFYIRASQCDTLRRRISEIPEEAWTEVEIDNSRCQLTSIPFEAFFPERGYRLVVQRTQVEDGQLSLLDGKYIYRSILTNDKDSTDEKVVLFYNRRGAGERVFDEMNNDFGWSHLPSSEMPNNTVFMLLTAFLRNFMMIFREMLAGAYGCGIEATSRMKKVVRNFMSVPFKWVVKGRQLWLRLYTNRPYECLRL